MSETQTNSGAGAGCLVLIGAAFLLLAAGVHFGAVVGLVAAGVFFIGCAILIST